MRKMSRFVAVALIVTMAFAMNIFAAKKDDDVIDSSDFTMYLYNNYVTNGGNDNISGNAVVLGNVTGLGWNTRVINGSLYADVSKINNYTTSKSVIDTYLTQTPYTGKVPDINLELKAFPTLAKKTNLTVKSAVNISESGWYDELNITNDGSTAFMITANEGQTIELRVGKLTIQNSITILGGGNVIFYVDDMITGSVPRLNENGDSQKVALFIADNKTLSFPNLKGNFNLYTNNSDITLNGSNAIIGNVYSNGKLTFDGTQVTGYVAGTSLNITMKGTALITGKLAAANATFEQGPKVVQGSVNEIKSGITLSLIPAATPTATPAATPTATPTPEATAEPTAEPTATPTPTATPIPTNPEYVNGLLGEYYDAAEVTNESAIRMKRIDSRPFFMWGYDAPVDVIEPETFAVKWTGYINPEKTETYKFKTLSDDGVKLTINRQNLINRWGLVNLEYTISEEITLEAGHYYPITLEYQQVPLNSLIYLFWETQSDGMSSVPASVFYVDKAIGEEYAQPKYFNILEKAGKGLTNNFYIENQSTPAFSEVAAVNYEWGLGAPKAITEDAFSATMEGYIEAMFTEQLTLAFVADDDLKVWIDDVLILDTWDTSHGYFVEGTFAAVAGQKHKIKIQYKDIGGGATCVMRWKSDSQPIQVVPAKYLYAE